MEPSLISVSQRVGGLPTFSSLRVGDLQVAVCGLEALSAHDLPLELAEGDVQPIKCDRVVVQFGRKLIVNTRHFHRSKHLSQPSTKTQALYGGTKTASTLNTRG